MHDPKLTNLVLALRPDDAEAGFRDTVVPRLIDRWLDVYCRTARSSDIVETEESSFSYLFDVSLGRLIAAWGISRGRHGAARDASRMSGHPRSGGERYHRGHAVPHRLGGGTDINLVPQLGSINIGAFRRLEIRAVATPGALYFTHWLYGAGRGQMPSGVVQGLLIAGQVPQITRHAN